MNMANITGVHLNSLATDPIYDFIKLFSENTDPDSPDFSLSPYENLQYKCNYRDENEYCTDYAKSAKFSIFSVNIQSLQAKFQQLKDLISNLQVHSCSPDIICLQEIWRFNDTANFKLEGYQPLIYKQRETSQGGGVGIYIKNGIKFIILETMSIFSARVYESICIEISLNNFQKTTICNSYRPGTSHPNLTQNEQFSEFIELLSNQLQHFSSNEKKIYFTGDLNLDLLKYYQSAHVAEYVDLLFSFGFYHTISKPTRITEHSATIIDHIATNYSTSVESVILVTDLSDHFPVIYFFTNTKCPAVPKFIETRDFSERNLNRFKLALQNINWNNVSDNNDTQLAYNIFEENFNTLFKLYFPVVKLKFNRNIHKLENWMSKGLLTSRNEKNRLHKLFLLYPTMDNKVKLKNYRTLYNLLIRAAKKMYYEKQFFKFQANQKKSWSTLYSAINKSSRNKEQIHSILINNLVINDSRRMAHEFNIFFTNIAKAIVDEIPPYIDQNEICLAPHVNSVFSFNNEPLVLTEIVNAIQSFEPKKTLDMNNLSMFFVSKFCNEISIPLFEIFKKSFASGIVPSQLKISKVIPVFKNGDRTQMDNYRPISLLNVFSKILEKIVANRMTNYFESNKLFSKFQFGFRKCHSTTHPLIKFVNSIARANNEKKILISIFCDLRKAFDTCDHSILLKKTISLWN